VENMTPRSSKLALSVLLGAGVLSLGWNAASAGDKINYSWSAEKTLAIPAVVHPDDHTDDLAFNHSSLAPMEDLNFTPQTTTITISPRNRNKKQNSLDGRSDPFSNDNKMNDPWANGDNQADEENSDTATNRLRIGMPKDWTSFSQKNDDLGLGYGVDDSTRDSSSLRRDRQSDTLLGKNIQREKSLAVQMENSRGLGSSHQSVMDRLREQSQYSTDLESYKHGQSSDLPQSYGSMDQSPLPSTSPLRPDYRSSESLFSQGNSYAPESSTHQSSFGYQAPAAPQHAWDAPASSSPNSQYYSTPAYTQPPPPSVPPNNSGFLAIPKNPTSPY
jgi:hypothetical protein